MLHIRVINTKGLSRAVQVIRYSNNKRIIVKHIGSGKTDDDIASLCGVASQYIKDAEAQMPLFPDQDSRKNILLLEQCEYLGFYYSFLYDILYKIQAQIGYIPITDILLTDLVIMRIVEPASKLRSIELIETYFGISHRRQRYYESALQWLNLKKQIEKQTLQFAINEYKFDFSLLFYDVTTLYFETFESDGLRKPGFSKDGKSQQPQILVGLMVTPEGFPVSYEIFPGNTFEGHTILPIIKSFIKEHSVQHFTVVADAAMISSVNIEALQEAKINYIVGARLGNISKDLFSEINIKLSRADGNIIRIKTDKGYLICSFSKKRYAKDKFEMDKQLEKAKKLLKQPSKVKNVKFLKDENKKVELNLALIAKTTALLGVKGYYTDIEESIANNNTVIERYHELYKIEQAFRVSKSDLQTRPIFHFKEEPIKLHMLICFMALTVSKHIEIKTATSLRAFLTMCKKVSDARILDKTKNKEIRMRTAIPKLLYDKLKSLNLPH
jgi:transposase